MHIEVLHGTEKRLYELVGALVMDPVVLRQNDNVAFKTTAQHTWFVAVKKGECIGFLPVKSKGEKGEINNYYILHRDREVFTTLVKEAERYLLKAGYKELLIIAQRADYEVVNGLNFNIDKPYVNYTRFSKEL